MRGSDEQQQGQPTGPRALLTGRRRWIAWVAFLVLAAYAPVLAALTHDDAYLFPLAVSAMVGYAIVVDDHLRRRAARSVPGPQTATRGRPEDSPGSVDVPSVDVMSTDASDQRDR